MATPVSFVEGSESFFNSFEALTGNRPYPWQSSLFSLFISGTVPADISLPTGAGKTAIMPIWLLALAWQASRGEEVHHITIPRRLVWVVDRRVVVDQATAEAEGLAARLRNETNISGLSPIREALTGLSVGNEAEPVAISTLRGEREDNGAWSTDPSQPAIIVGTVDMIGSRLLFSGYGDGRSRRAQHAGLLGCDVLLVNDEAHLTPAFADLIGNIEREQKSGGKMVLKPLRIIRLSATHGGGKECWPKSLDSDREDTTFRKVFEAKKQLHIDEVVDVDAKFLELAMQPGVARTLIFVREPAKVQRIADAIQQRIGDSASGRIITLTGTMRGFERDRLVRDPVFLAFAASKRVDRSCWMIATAAGEVGVNISSDRLLTDLDTTDHLLQRFGRLNRFGETDGEARVIYSPKQITGEKENALRLKATLRHLRNLPRVTDSSYDISTAALSELPPSLDGWSEIPLQAPLHSWHVDVWSQTTLGVHPARPQVEPWLHGKQDDYPETYVAWRDEVRDLSRMDPEDVAETLQKYPVMAHERLREPTNLFHPKLNELLHRGFGDDPMLRQSQDGSVTVLTIRDIAEGRREDIAYCQLILPRGCGRLTPHGMFSAECSRKSESATGSETPEDAGVHYDVAGCKSDGESDEVIYSDDRACYRAQSADDGGWVLERLGSVPEQRRERASLRDLTAASIRTFCVQRNWRFLSKLDPPPPENDESTRESALLYFRKDRSYQVSSAVVRLKDHSAAVACEAEALGRRLRLPGEIVQALTKAGEFHDLGKGHPLWQQAAGNDDLTNAVAKSVRPMRPSLLRGFRHELVSLRLAEDGLGGLGLPQEVCDLILHLIAAHHGCARPCFTKKNLDRNNRRESERLSLDTVRRFARLQDRYGPWGLAYLEAILKSADALASMQAGRQVENG